MTMDPRPDLDATTGQPVEPAFAPPTSTEATAADATDAAALDTPEATTSSVPTTTVAAATGPSRARWLIGGGIAIAAIAGLAIIISILSARPLP
jgi:hypothetical protein